MKWTQYGSNLKVINSSHTPDVEPQMAEQFPNMEKNIESRSGFMAIFLGTYF